MGIVQQGSVHTEYRRPTWTDLTGKARDGLTAFSVMWSVALIFSTVSHYQDLAFRHGLSLALLQWLVVGSAVALILQPRRLSLLALLAGAMTAQYIFRLPVASNNQTIAFFMNISIITVVGVALSQTQNVEFARQQIYERLRVVARYTLAIMYFYGIFHKINVDFLNPETSCAVSLYKPLTSFFGLDESLIGRYGAIYATFVVEAFAIFCLFARRYFAYGLIAALAFHYIIPISAYSWYMDFSSLVFALYALSIPREVSIAFYERGAAILRRFPSPLTGGTALGAFVVLILLALLVASLLRLNVDDFNVSSRMLWHSSWIMIWAIVGGAAMLLLTKAALEALPYQPAASRRPPVWIYLFPSALFISCLAPYLGLKTESSIAMFSNLHTEGGNTNHLLVSRPLYLFNYQQDVAIIEESSDSGMQQTAQRGLGLVRYSLERWMEENPGEWVTFSMNGRRYQQANAASFPITPPNQLERRLLVFKPVDVARPKVCSH